MHQLALAEELDGVVYVGVIRQPQNVVVGRTRLLLCCNIKSATFDIGRATRSARSGMGVSLKIPMYLDGYVSCPRNARSNYDFIDQNLHHFTCQMLYIDVLFDQLAAVVANGGLDFDRGNLFLAFKNLRFKPFLLRCEILR